MGEVVIQPRWSMWCSTRCGLILILSPVNFARVGLWMSLSTWLGVDFCLEQLCMKMKVNELLTSDEMREFYGSFYSASCRVPLDPANVPNELWPLLPYA